MINLHSLRHSCVTKLSDGCINNADATLLIISNLDGVATSRQLKCELRAWRAAVYHSYDYLFNTSVFGGYGFVGDNVESISNTVHTWSSGRRYSTRDRSTYWYRKKRGVYAITTCGMSRLAYLKMLLGNKRVDDGRIY